MSKTKEKRAQILRSAEDLLATSGSAALSMRKVAEKTGISLGNLQYHFATRDDLFAGVLSVFVQRYATALKSLELTRSGDLQRDLFELLLSTLSSSEFSEDGRIFKELWAEAQHSEGLTVAFTAYYSDLAEFYAGVFRSLTVSSVSSERVTQAVSLLLPLLEGHCITKPMIPYDAEALARTWSNAITACLTENG